MDVRKNSLYTAKLCRFCLSQDEPLTGLFEKKQGPKNSVPLSLKILSSISVEVFPSERMPPYICRRCTFFMDIVYSFKNICREGDKSILQFVQTGSALEPTVWPPSLVKLFRYGVKSKKETAVMKVEGGATVEVSQDMSDSEDDDENVYNVKIGDGSEEGASACVKVVTSKDNEKPRKEKKKDSDDVEVESAKPAPAQDRCWACDECDCTYPLQQLLELHKMQKHRNKDINCEVCDAKFFTKYDLAVHMLRHSNEMRFECVACGKRFKRLIQLKRHEKSLHAELPQLRCPHCPASFLSADEREAHQSRHRHADRKHACTYCDKRFFEHSALIKHIESMHESKQMHGCEYCPLQFMSITKLTKHVRTHAGERPYPCKYCEKSFTKSHHYTRHLRSKHSEVSRGTRSSLDEYRCEQCTAAFQSQDELIYHSAIHATQNLTCPLCQERSPDVDAVTAHIKSHVNGMEFMCDFCELVFTSKDKLDLHIDNAHEDELQNSEFGQDDTSMEMDGEEDDDDNAIKVKDEGDHMVVEIKKPNEFMLHTTDRETEEKMNYTNSEESEPESAMMEEPPLPAHESPPALLPPLTPAPSAVTAAPVMISPAPAPFTCAPAPLPSAPAVLTSAVVTPVINVASPVTNVATPVTQSPIATPVRAPQKMDTSTDSANPALTASILRKAEEIKRKVIQETPPQEKKEKPKVESSIGGASDKSLRLLEKELQELQRTNKREEVKTPIKSLETIRGRGRPPMHTSTPKLRSEERKPVTSKSTPTEKKAPERRAVKENKKPDDSKESKTNNGNGREDKDKTKENKDKTKEEKPKEDKDKTREDKEIKIKEEKEAKANVSKEDSKDKSAVKNGSNANNKSASEEPVRRSARPSKVKDYAKMINHRSEESKQSDDDSDDDDEEYIEAEKSEGRGGARRASHKPGAKPAAPAPPAAAPARKRGRPRKNAPAAEVPAKVKKSDNEENEEVKTDQLQSESITDTIKSDPEESESKETNDTSQDEPANAEQNPPNQPATSPGQTLKKVPIKALPPGVKPLPLPTTARQKGTPEMCQMQIGKKVVKVQKIVMTKAEVEAMAKKGLVEMKDGTMVLKAGVKIAPDPNSVRSTLVAEGERGKQ